MTREEWVAEGATNRAQWVLEQLAPCSCLTDRDGEPVPEVDGES